jgi:predicted O-linked N-acetylglucosamine transferase (SPINDLY family)
MLQAADACIGSGRLTEALALLERAIVVAPQDANLRFHAGNVASHLDQYERAEVHLGAAIALNAEVAGYYEAYGQALLELRKLGPAEAALRRTLALDPNSAGAACNLGCVLMQNRDYTGAVAQFRRALELSPNLPQAHLNLGAALFFLGRVNEAILSHRAAIASAPELPDPYGSLLGVFCFLPDAPCGLIAETALRWSRLLKRQAQHPGWRNAPLPGRRLRVGYVSADFRSHPVAFFLEGVLAAHDPNAVEIYCYSNNAENDPVTDRLESLVDHWRPISDLDDGAAAALIRTDEIDILVDLSGHTTRHRLKVFLLMPAPIQCTWLGFFATTGLPEIDYIIADRFVLQPEDERFYVEKPWRMPDSYLCFTPPDIAVDIDPLPAQRHGAITFGSCNNVLKVNKRVVGVWSQLLHAVPGSRLLLRAAQLSDAEVRDELARQFAERGIGAERLSLLPFGSRTETLQTYNAIDIALDPFPYGGGTTTVEALWMGVPVVSLRGDRFSGRVSESILATIGRPELVTDSEVAYLATAIELARDWPRLSALRAGLRGQVMASPLCDAPRFTRHLEQAYRTMWRKWCDDREPTARHS